MKRFIKCMMLTAVIIGVVFNSQPYAGTFISGSTGADGSFAPTVDTELQLSPNGVFNFTTVDIPAGVSVTFKRNAANTPVYILATGDVNIAGTISVNGENGRDGTSVSTGNIGEPTVPVYGGKGGPGGFDGGRGGLYSQAVYPELAPSAGLGPGGGKIYNSSNSCYSYSPRVKSGGGGGYLTDGGRTYYNCLVNGNAYGNELLIPLLGGSGGSGGFAGYGYSGYPNGGGGGGGGGAILIASSGAIVVTGAVTARGGTGGKGNIYSGGSGSGGAVRFIANTIRGNGVISAAGGDRQGGYNWDYYGGNGAPGRIRLETYILERTAQTDPVASTISKPKSVFVANLPTLTITSIGGTPVPGGSTGSFETPDVTLPSVTTNPVTLNISAVNVPVGTTVSITVVPKSGESSTFTSTPLSGTDAGSTATVDINLPTGVTASIQASATFTVQQTASNPTPIYAEGEKVLQIKVASAIGGKSSVLYITESGREVPAGI